MRIVDVTDARLESTLRRERDELVSRHLEARKRASTVPSRPSQKIPEDGGAADPTPVPHKKWKTKLVHPTYQLVGEECPNCGFPEAEGGYCEDCGWSLPHPFKN